MFSFSNFLTFSLSVCALFVTFIFVNREIDLIQGEERVHVANWQSIPVGSQALGNRTGRTQVIVLFDYECPYCAQLDNTLLAIFDEASEEISLSFKNVPLDIHPGAFPKAVASLCASEQGQFRRYHEALFSVNPTEETDFMAIARAVGVQDEAAFASCLTNTSTVAQVKADRKLAQSLGLDGVPALIIDGGLYVGALNETQLRKALGRGAE